MIIKSTPKKEIIVVLLFLFYQNILFAQYQITASVLGSGGKSTESDYKMTLTLGEPLIGVINSSINQIESGFWYVYGSGIISSSEEEELLPTDFLLEQNYPNPFNPITTIGFSLPNQTAITIKLYNMLGEHVKTIVEGIYNAGNYEVVFDAKEIASGAYIYRIESENFVIAKKLVLLK